jgi:membrane-bound lytic murein transglycosylase B
MVTRRVLLAAPLLAVPFAANARDGFAAFLQGLRAEAFSAGISAATVRAALGELRVNPKVLELDRHQPEFTLTWAQYKAKVLPATRLQAGNQAARRDAALLAAVRARYGVESGIVVGIWGLESGFGGITGKYGVVEALATLAYDGRRASYFRGELINALRILDSGDITPGGMTGSWAGAMGQPQFMPSSYLRYAVDFDGDGKRDIWTSRADVFASISNYLAKSGWHPGQPWGQPIRLPRDFNQAEAGRDRMRPLGAWQAAGVRRIDGTKFSRAEVPGAVILPDGPAGEAYMVYANFNVIRRYNPSDYYALAVGLLGNASA